MYNLKSKNQITIMKNHIFIKLLSSIVFVSFFSACSASSSENNNDEKKEEVRTKVLIETELGNMVVELYNETPLHRDNFIKLVEEEFYNGTLFHRVINEFMVQGGDPESIGAEPRQRLGTGGPGYQVPAEFTPELFHVKGALAAARQGDQVNPERESSGSQFYIVQGRVFSEEELTMLEQRSGIEFSEEQKKAYSTLGGTPFLDTQYTVFGIVVEGLDVIDKIAVVETNPMDRPIEDIKVTMSIIE